MTKTRYILVADGGSARIFRTDSNMAALDLIDQQSNVDGRLTPGELESDRPGIQRSGTGGYHGLGGDADPQRHAADQFAASLARALHQAHLAGQFDELLIAAPPRFLGDLRQHLSTDCQKVLAATVNKDLVRASDTDIIAHFA